jgi:streptomycin 6-kinase
MQWWDGNGAAKVYCPRRRGHASGTGARARARCWPWPCLARTTKASRIICDTVARLHAPRHTKAAAHSPRPMVPRTGTRCQHPWRHLRRLPDDRRRPPRPIPAIRSSCTATSTTATSSISTGTRLAGDRSEGSVRRARLRLRQHFRQSRPSNRHRSGSSATAAADRIGRSDIEPQRLLRWIAAYCGLSAAWFLADGATAEAESPLAVARIALAELPIATAALASMALRRAAADPAGNPATQGCTHRLVDRRMRFGCQAPPPGDRCSSAAARARDSASP